MEVARNEALSRLRRMDPYEFERFVAELWNQHGYSTRVRKGSGDRGIDIVATKRNPTQRKELIQVKRYSASNKVGSRDVRLYATLYQQEDDADEVVIVTTSELTTEAEKLAEDLSVTAVDGDDLYRMIQQDGHTHFSQWSTGSESQRSNRKPRVQSASSSSSSYTPSTPWKTPCPFCSEKIHYAEDSFIQHWANSSTCDFSKGEPKDISVINGDWSDTVEKVERERERTTQPGTPHSACPFCNSQLEHRSTKAYLYHWTNGSCRRHLKSLPDQRPSEVPVSIWWEIKDRWDNYEKTVSENSNQARGSSQSSSASKDPSEDSATTPSMDVSESRESSIITRIQELLW